MLFNRTLLHTPLRQICLSFQCSLVCFQVSWIFTHPVAKQHINIYLLKVRWLMMKLSQKYIQRDQGLFSPYWYSDLFTYALLYILTFFFSVRLLLYGYVSICLLTDDQGEKACNVTFSINVIVLSERNLRDRSCMYGVLFNPRKRSLCFLELCIRDRPWPIIPIS